MTEDLDKFSERVLNTKWDQIPLVDEENEEEMPGDLPPSFQSRKIRHVSFGLGISNGEKAYLISRPDICQR